MATETRDLCSCLVTRLLGARLSTTRHCRTTAGVDTDCYAPARDVSSACGFCSALGSASLRQVHPGKQRVTQVLGRWAAVTAGFLLGRSSANSAGNRCNILSTNHPTRKVPTQVKASLTSQTREASKTLNSDAMPRRVESPTLLCARCWRARVRGEVLVTRPPAAS